MFLTVDPLPIDSHIFGSFVALHIQNIIRFYFFDYKANILRKERRIHGLKPPKNRPRPLKEHNYKPLEEVKIERKKVTWGELPKNSR